MPWLLCPWDFPGKNTGLGCHFLLQGIVPTQGSNPCLYCLLHWQEDSLPLSHGGTSGKEHTCQYWRHKRQISTERLLNGLPWWLRWQRIRLQYRRPGFNPWVGKIPWRRGWLPTPVSLSGEFHGQRSLVGYSPRGLKELDMSERLSKTTCLSVLGIISSSKQSRPQKLRNFDLPTNCLKEFAQRCLFLE